MTTQPKHTFTFSITPILTTTYHQQAILFIQHLDHPQQLTSVIPHTQTPQSILFWLTLFKTAHKHTTPLITNKIRRFIKHYLFLSYKIPTAQLSSSINLNITYNFHSQTNHRSLTQLHHLINHSHSPHPLFNKIYTTTKINSRISDIILNHRAFFKSFNLSNPPTCSCHSLSTNPLDHTLLFPHQLTRTIQKTLRNIEQPTQTTITDNLAHVTNQLLSLLSKLNTLKLLPPRTSPVNISLSKQHITITSSQNQNQLKITFNQFHKFLSKQPQSSNLFNFTTTQNLLHSITNTTHPLKAIYPLPQTDTPPVITLAWLLGHNLFCNGVSITNITKSISLFYNTFNTKPQHKHSNLLLLKIKQLYANYIFIPIDHNARQAAIICPIRLHHYTLQTYIDDTKHFTILHNTTIPDLHKTITNNAPKNFKYKIKNKATIPNLYLIIKSDSRLRPIGSYSAAACKPLLSIASNGLNRLLKSTPLKHKILFNATQLKRKIAAFNQFATANNLTITFKSFDVKNFYTEINHETLIKRLDYTLYLYHKTHHSTSISFPKHDKSLPTITKPTNNPEYITITLTLLRQILLFAINNSFFSLGHHLLQQILGLPMG